MAGPDTVDDYLAQVPAEARAVLEELRSTIKAVLPDAVETISYQMPTFKYRGRAVVGYAAFKQHCSLFPYSARVLTELARELGPFDTSGKGTVRFTAREPLPAAIVERIVRVRIEEIERRGST